MDDLPDAVYEFLPYRAPSSKLIYCNSCERKTRNGAGTAVCPKNFDEECPNFDSSSRST